jgi:hypothetical protein
VVVRELVQIGEHALHPSKQDARRGFGRWPAYRNRVSVPV